MRSSLLEGHCGALLLHQRLVIEIREPRGLTGWARAVAQRLPALPAVEAELPLHAVPPPQEDLLAEVRVLFMEVHGLLERNGSICPPPRQAEAVDFAGDAVFAAYGAVEGEELLLADQVAVLAR